jgi:hypothetical protein
MNDRASPPTAYLLKFIDDYIGDIRLGAVNENMALTDQTAIYLFYENFFFQFFDYCFGKDSITGFDENAKEQATRFRMSLHGTGKQATTAVISDFEDFCDARSDLTAGKYFATRDNFVQFHKNYIPELLADIGIWATAEGLNELAQRSQRAMHDYQATVTPLWNE